MKLFGKFKEKRLTTMTDNEREVVVAVPDIKEYLVREYNRANDLKLIIEGQEQQLEKAEETKLKYDAALVTLDEYSKRLERAESEIETCVSHLLNDEYDDWTFGCEKINCCYNFSDIGKTVFLTPEEAEKALKEGADNG